MTKKNDNSIGANLSQIEDVAKSLETENLSLEQSLEKYELGISLIRETQRQLEAASQRVQLLSIDPEDDSPLTDESE